MFPSLPFSLSHLLNLSLNVTFCYCIVLVQNRTQEILKEKIQLDNSICISLVLCVSKQTFVYLLHVCSRTERKFKIKRGRQEQHSREEKPLRHHSFDSGFNIIYSCDLPKTLYDDFDLKIPSRSNIL